MEEIDDFVQALYVYVQEALREVDEVTYSPRGVQIVDARNHLFRAVEGRMTDEEEGVYRLADLCRVDEELRTVPDRMRMRRVARNYW